MPKLFTPCYYLKYADKPRSKVKPLLWPVLVYRVLYPEVKRPAMNLFQKAVLGLLRARVTSTDMIAEMTGLHEDLISLIFVQCYSRGWINELADAVTDKGLNALDREEDVSQNLKSGYLFQDAITGKLWPRFENRLNEIEPIDPYAQFPEFSLSRRTGHLLKPFVVRHSSTSLPPPDNKSLLAAYQDYRQDFRASVQLYGSSELPEQLRLQGIQSLSEMPTSAHVLVWVTGNSDGYHSNGYNHWSIKDPFEIRENAYWLIETLKQSVRKDKNLLSQLSELVDTPMPERQSAEEWLRDLDKQTDLKMLMEYPWAERQPDIRCYMADLLNRREKFTQGQTHRNDLESAVMESQKLLEVLLQWLIRRFPAESSQLPNQRKHKKHEPEFNADLLKALALRSFSDNVIHKVARLSLVQAVKAQQQPSQSLKTLLFSAALGVASHPEHPLRELTAQQLQLEKMLDLADLRNQSSHGQSRYTGKKRIDITEEIAKQQIDYALQLTEYFKEWM